MPFLSPFLLYFFPKRNLSSHFWFSSCKSCNDCLLLTSQIGAISYIATVIFCHCDLNLPAKTCKSRLHSMSRRHPACDSFTQEIHCPLWWWQELHMLGSRILPTRVWKAREGCNPLSSAAAACCLPPWEHLSDRFSGSALSQNRISTGTFALTAAPLISALTSAAWLLKNA